MSDKQYTFLIVIIIATGVGVATTHGLHFISLFDGYKAQLKLFEERQETNYQTLSTRMEDLAQIDIVIESQREILEELKKTRNLPVTQLPPPDIIEMEKVRKQLIEIQRQLGDINLFIYEQKGGQNE